MCLILTVWFVVGVVIVRVQKERQRRQFDHDDDKIADKEGHVLLNEGQAGVSDQGSEEDDGVETANRKL